MEITKILHG